MASNRIPTELIRDILSPLLHIEDYLIHKTSKVSPFARENHVSTAEYLRVSKAWLNAGVPLLYRVVILRSKAQAAALQRTLKKHVSWGAFVRKLRVEGGYGDSMRTIILASPNITDLFLSLRLSFAAKDDAKGLCSSIATINPTCVTIWEPISELTKIVHNKALASAIAACIASETTWSNMTHLNLFCLGPDCSKAIKNRILDAVVDSRNLRTVDVHRSSGISTLKRLSDSTALKLVTMTGVIVDSSDWVLDDGESNPPGAELSYAVRSNPKLSALVKLVWKKPETTPISGQSADILPPVNRSFIPLHNTSDDVRDLIWARIFYFAMDCEVEQLSGDGEVPALEQCDGERWNIARVSRLFRRLALPLIYGHPVFCAQAWRLSDYVKYLKKDPTLGRYLKTFAIDRHGWSTDFSQSLNYILRHTPNLVRLGTISPERLGGGCYMDCLIQIDLPTFEALAQTAGPNVKVLHQVAFGSNSRDCDRYNPKAIQLPSPSTFGKFTALRSLHCTVNFKFAVTRKKIDKSWLGNLVNLHLGVHDDSFLKLLILLNLNNLKSVSLECDSKQLANVQSFLQKHGSKLETLECCNTLAALPLLDLCPSIENLSLWAIEAPPIKDKIFFGTAPHKHLSTLNLYIFWPIGLLWKEAKDPIYPRIWGDFFGKTDWSCVPQLREIRANCFSWPTNEYDILKSSRSYWIKWQSALDQRWNIKLLDKERKIWRPRLGT